jgi:DNA-binding transcriptional LysR family regulator
MDLRQLEYTVAVAEELSFTRAAARCHIVQSGLSYQIARLERELGTPLFERTSRSVRLTPAGELLLPHARRVLGDLESATAEISALTGLVQGNLRLGVIPVNHGSVDLPAVLQRYHRRYPAVDVIVSDTGSVAMVTMLLAWTLDAAFLGLFADQLPAGLAHRVVTIEPLVAIVDEASPCAGRTSADLRELAATSSFIDCHHDSGLRTQVDLAFARARVTRHVSFELGNLLDVARMAALGLGVAIVPASVAHAIPDPGGRFSVVRLTDPLALQPVNLVFRDPAPGSPAARAFIDLFAETDLAAFRQVIGANPDPAGESSGSDRGASRYPGRAGGSTLET